MLETNNSSDFNKNSVYINDSMHLTYDPNKSKRNINSSFSSSLISSTNSSFESQINPSSLLESTKSSPQSLINHDLSTNYAQPKDNNISPYN